MRRLTPLLVGSHLVGPMDSGPPYGRGPGRFSCGIIIYPPKIVIPLMWSDIIESGRLTGYRHLDPTIDTWIP